MSRQPTVEEMFIAEAVKRLTSKQRTVWEYWNLDRLTQDEIAEKLGKARTTIQSQIKQCEKSITKWCKNHQFVYELLKAEYIDPGFEDKPNGEQEAYDWLHKVSIRQSNKDQDD